MILAPGPLSFTGHLTTKPLRQSSLARIMNDERFCSARVMNDKGLNSNYNLSLFSRVHQPLSWPTWRSVSSILVFSWRMRTMKRWRKRIWRCPKRPKCCWEEDDEMLCWTIAHGWVSAVSVGIRNMSSHYWCSSVGRQILQKLSFGIPLGI